MHPVEGGPLLAHRLPCPVPHLAEVAQVVLAVLVHLGLLLAAPTPAAAGHHAERRHQHHAAEHQIGRVAAERDEHEGHHPERGHDLDLRLFEHRADRAQVGGDARTALEDRKASDAQVQPVDRHLGPAVAKSAHDPAPVGVAAMDRGLHQARGRDSSRRQPRIIARRRACDAHGEQLGRALTVPRDRPREPLRHLQQRAQQHFRLWAARADGRVACGAVGEHQERVVGGAVAVDSHLVEAQVGHRFDHRGHQARFDRGIGRDVGEHRGHVRMDHARALAHPADPYRHAAEVDLELGQLGLRVGGHDRVRRVEPMRGIQVSARVDDPRLDSLHRHVSPNHAGRAHQHLVGVEVEVVRGDLRHQQRILESLRAGACIRVA